MKTHNVLDLQTKAILDNRTMTLYRLHLSLGQWSKMAWTHSPVPYKHPVHTYLVAVTGRLQNGIDYWFPPYHRSVALARRLAESNINYISTFFIPFLLRVLCEEGKNLEGCWLRDWEGYNKEKIILILTVLKTLQDRRTIWKVRKPLLE